ncbi:uncharacterized protein LOC142320861 isoform X2 [Lycorma delicatula]|uniref:uncharacterized protein LOC142320861 isoform X2 n=1 Tax=Lycorma delicatula TaxID=130591 RepID=UPI003F50FF7C
MTNVIKIFTFFLTIRYVRCDSEDTSSSNISSEDKLDTHECKIPFYKFVSNKGKNIFINLQVVPGAKDNEVSDMNKFCAIVDVKENGPKEVVDKALFKYMIKLLLVKEEQLRIIKDNGTHKTLMIANHNRSKYSVLHKIAKAWEPFDVHASDLQHEIDTEEEKLLDEKVNKIAMKYEKIMKKNSSVVKRY